MKNILLSTLLSILAFAATAHAGCADLGKAAEDAVQARLSPMVCKLTSELEPELAQRGPIYVYRVTVGGPCTLGDAPSNLFDVQVTSEIEGGACSTKIIGD